MPEPKDFMDDDHEYVKGYVRRKQAYPTVGHKRNLWFWRLAWYWRLLIFFGGLFGIIALIIVSLLKNPLILLGLLGAGVLWFIATHPPRRRKQGKKLTRDRKIGLF